jgi:hypothetical protein
MRSKVVPVMLSLWLHVFPSFAAAHDPAAAAAIRAGISSYNAGDYEAAVQAFRQAYTAEPDSETLYQLGKAYAMADWPVEAVDAFERYLSAAPPALSANRRLELGLAIDGQRRRIGTLALQVTPEEAHVALDGAVLDRAALSRPLAVRQGPHVLAASLDGYVTQVQSVEVRGRESALVRLVLVPERPPVREGLLGIQCPVPAVSILVDDRPVGTTPLEGPLMVSEGTHRLRLERSGYRPQTTSIRVTSAKTTRIGCDLPLLRPLVASGRLDLDFPETGAELRIDGTPATKSSVLPPGLHWVEIRHYGFLPWTRELGVDMGQVHRVDVVLTPTPAYVHDVEQRAQHRRSVSYVLGATGLGIAATALGIGLWNDSRYSDWKRERAALEDDYAGSSRAAGTPSELERRRNDVNGQLRSIHAVDIATAILGATGGVLLGSGAWLYFTADDFQRPARQPVSVRHATRELGVDLVW